MAWVYLVIAGFFEMGWAIGLKYTEGFTRLVPTTLTVAAMIISVILLGLALRDLPVGGLKLDRSFTVGVASGDQRSIRVSQGLAGLARGLALRTVVEGIQGERDAAILLGQGWTMAQGWYFGRPAREMSEPNHALSAPA